LAVIRCPQCGRAADGIDCLACGYTWPSAASRPPSVDFGNPATDLSALQNPAPIPGGHEAPVAGHSNPFGVSVPSQGAPDPVSGVARLPAGGVPPRPADVTLDGSVPAAHRPSTTQPTPAPSFPAPGAPAPVAARAPHRPPSPPGVPTPPQSPAVPASSAAAASGLPEGVDQAARELAAALDGNTDDVVRPRTGSSLSGRVLALLPFPQDSGAERFLRTRWAIVAAALTPFLLVLAVGAPVMFSGGDPFMSRIDGGQASAVIEELLARSSAARTPRESLLLGHAYARTGETAVALRHYADAGRRSGGDKRALDYIFLALDHAHADRAARTLSEWRGNDVVERLQDACSSPSWHLRHNAKKVLKARNQATNEVLERVAILDITSAELCDDRRAALLVLETIGAGGDAIDAIEAMWDEKFTLSQNHCMRQLEYERVLKKVKER
jgi:hypothetical protein